MDANWVRGLSCEERSVTLDQINGGHNIDLLEFRQPFKKASFAWGGEF
jgi:hypothetical protein